MNRTVLNRQMFRYGGPVKKMEMGGDPMAPAAPAGVGMEEAMAAQPQDMGMAGAAPTPEAQMANQAVGAGLDPNVLSGMLQEAAQGIGNLDEAQDLESVMNMMRGDQASVQDRRDELASIIGPEDAAQTPESALALLQPVIMMNQVDEGIGGMAQAAMDVPVEGPMAEGIMSTMGAGETPTANFSQGGAVRRLQAGGNPATAPVANPASIQNPYSALGLMGMPTLKDEFANRKEMYRDILGDDQERKNLTQAQMLFDVAQAGLALATPPSRSGQSFASNLAEKLGESKLFEKIGARAAQEQEAQQKVDLAALSSAETALGRKEQAGLDYLTALAKKKTDKSFIQVKMPDGKIRVFNTDTALGEKGLQSAVKDGGMPYSIGAPSATEAKPDMYEVTFKDGSTQFFDLSKPSDISKYTTLQKELGGIKSLFKAGTKPSGKDKAAKVKGVYGPDGKYISSFNVNDDADVIAMDKLLKATPGSYPANLPTASAPDVIGDKEYFTKYGMDKKTFEDQPADVKNRLMGVTPDPVTKIVKGQIVDVTNPNDPKVVFGDRDEPTPKWYTVTIDGSPTVIDANTKPGKAMIDKVNAANKAAPGSATMETVTSAPTPQAYLIDGQLRMSYDKGRTYTLNGEIKKVPEDAFKISDTTSYEVHKAEQIRSRAGKALEKLDGEIAQQLGKDGAVNSSDITAVVDALKMAREGTGFYSNLVAGFDALSGFLPEAIRPSGLFEDNADARQYLRGVTTLGRSALVVNPRFPVAEMERVEALFVKPDSFFVNPETEARKFTQLKSLATQQYRRNLEMLSQGGLSKDDAAAVEKNNLEIKRLLSLLPGVPLSGSNNTSRSDAVNAAGALIRGD